MFKLIKHPLFLLLTLIVLSYLIYSCDQSKVEVKSDIYEQVSSDAPSIGAIMHKEYVKTIGRMAYVWGWPIVNSHNRRTRPRTCAAL